MSDFEDLKKLIRSFLISSPIEMTIGKLKHDYLEEVGEEIPHAKFGYNSLEALLQNMPDVLQVIGNGPKALLQVVVNTKVAHIDKLIAKQRIQESKKGRFGSHPLHKPQRRSRILYDNFNNQQLAASATYNSQPLYQKKHPVAQQQFMWSPPFSFTPSRYVFSNYGQSVPTTNEYCPPLRPRYQYNLKKSTPTSTVYKQKKQLQTSPKLQNTKLDSPTASMQENKAQNMSIEPNETRTNLKLTSQSLVSSDEASPSKSTSSYKSAESKDVNNCSAKPVFSLSPDIMAEELYFSDGSESRPDKIDPPASPKDELANYSVPFEVQEKLKEFIHKYPDGVWCRDVPKLYSCMFNKQLDYVEYGYMSLIQMCMDLENIFYCHRPDKEDFMLFDRRKPLPANIVKNDNYLDVSSEDEENLEGECREPAIVGAEDLVKEILYGYPPEVLQLQEEIPRQFLPDGVGENDFIDVYIGEVYDPSKFWLLLKDYSDELDNLMDNMQTFYVNPKNNLEIPMHMLKKGLYCAAQYANEYHRAVIVQGLIDNKSDKIKVFYFDYGTLASIEAKGLYFLHRKFAKLPKQAIRARLASIWPPVGYTPWSIHASSRFLSMVKCKCLVAHIHRIDREKQTIEIFLADTSTEVDIYMNDALVQEGYALFTSEVNKKGSSNSSEESNASLYHVVQALKTKQNNLKNEEMEVKDSCEAWVQANSFSLFDTEQQPRTFHHKVPKYKYMHLFPNFDDLEWGNVPSATEILRLARAGIQGEYMYPNYYEEISNPKDLAIDKEEDELMKRDKSRLKHTMTEFDLSAETAAVAPDHSYYESSEDLDECLASLDWTQQLENEEMAVSQQSQAELDAANLSSPLSNISSSFASPKATSSLDSCTTKKVQPPPGFENLHSTAAQSNMLNTLFLSQPTIMNSQMLLPVGTHSVLPQPIIVPQLMQAVALQPLSYVPTPQSAALSGFSMAHPNQQHYLWSNMNMPFQQQAINAHTPSAAPGISRLDLQTFLLQHIASGDVQTLYYLGELLRKLPQANQTANQTSLLFKILYEALHSKSVVLPPQKLEIIIQNLLNLLSDTELLCLVKVKMENIKAQTNVNSTAELLTLLSQLSVNEKSECANPNVSKTPDEVTKTDGSVSQGTKGKRHKKHVIKADLKNHQVQLIRFNDKVYVSLSDILQYTPHQCTTETVNRIAAILNPLQCVTHIDLQANKSLAKELLGEDLVGSTMCVVQLTLVPEVAKILGASIDLSDNHNEFLQKYDVGSDVWLKD